MLHLECTRNCYKQIEVASKLSTSLRISDYILRIIGTNTSGAVHINCDSFRMAIWQIVGLSYRSFENLNHKDVTSPVLTKSEAHCIV